MSNLFKEKGPTAEQILAEQRKQAEKRRRGVNQQARELKTQGVQGQLLGARNVNPSQNLPGSS